MTDLTPEIQEELESFLDKLDGIENERMEEYEQNKDQIKLAFFTDYYQSPKIISLQTPLRYYDVYIDETANFSAYDVPLYRTDYYRGREIRNKDDEITSKGTYLFSVFSAMILGARVTAPTYGELLQTINAMK